MAVTPGSRIGPYEILAPLGAGGMGEVYRALDSKLNRSVAIKVLLPAVVGDPDRVARFRREAQLLASLNHQNIGAVYGFEDSAGVHALVMELVEGPTLADRIAQGPVPVDEALSIARQIAQALEAAHDRGIVHRDLKPANVKLRLDGTVKVLDFGLAKAFDVSSEIAADNPAAFTQSPTITSPAMTALGVILGTAAYMSPEQAKGRPVDKRSDVWAFGCVLYEMLTGVRPFGAPGDNDVTDMLASVLKTEPDWNLMPPSAPPQVRALIRGCLEKERLDRVGDLSTAIFLLRPQQLSALPASPPKSAVRTRAAFVAAGAVAGAALAIAAVTATKRQPAPPPVSRFTIMLPAGQQLTMPRPGVAIAPDGSRIAYSADGRLYTRVLSENDPKPVLGGEQGMEPAFSPDGQSLVFWTDGALKRINVNGGTAITICETNPAPSSLSWTADSILFAEPGAGIQRLPPSGGKPETLVALRAISDGDAHGPQLLSDGDSLLFTLSHRTTANGIDPWLDATVVVQSLKTGVRRTLIEGGTDARYLPTGHLLYVVGGTLFAAPFDVRRQALTGEAVPIVEGVRRPIAVGTGGTHMAISASGTLVYAPGSATAARSTMAFFDRQGHAEPVRLAPGDYAYPRVSPDGRRIAFETHGRRETQIEIYDLSGSTSQRRLTYGGSNRMPIWSPDSRRVAFQSDRDGDVAIFWQSAEGGVAERLTKPETGVVHVAESFSPDGEVLLIAAAKGPDQSLLMVSMRDRKVAPFHDVRSVFFPTDAAFSPDGKWVAYQTAVASSGEGTLYVEPFPADGSKYQIARGGRPAWSRDGLQLFYVPAPARFETVTVTTRPSFTFTPPTSLPRGFGVADPAFPRPYDVLPDGRFIGMSGAAQTPAGSLEAGQLRVVLNWFEELKQRAPAK